MNILNKRFLTDDQNTPPEKKQKQERNSNETLKACKKIITLYFEERSEKSLQMNALEALLRECKDKEWHPQLLSRVLKIAARHASKILSECSITSVDSLIQRGNLINSVLEHLIIQRNHK